MVCLIDDLIAFINWNIQVSNGVWKNSEEYADGLIKQLYCCLFIAIFQCIFISLASEMTANCVSHV